MLDNLNGFPDPSGKPVIDVGDGQICNRFAVAPCSFSFLRMRGSEKNRLDLDFSKQFTLFVLRRDMYVDEWSTCIHLQEP